MRTSAWPPGLCEIGVVCPMLSPKQQETTGSSVDGQIHFAILCSHRCCWECLVSWGPGRQFSNNSKSTCQTHTHTGWIWRTSTPMSLSLVNLSCQRYCSPPATSYIALNTQFEAYMMLHCQRVLKRRSFREKAQNTKKGDALPIRAFF